MISVIMTTWNRAHLIRESIHSVLRQTYADLELVIADDGSEDETEKVVSSISDKRIRYFKLPRCGYISRVRNFAIQQSQGSCLAFMDSDDLWKDDKLEKQMQLMAQQPSIGFSITGASDFRDDQIIKENIYPGKSGIECTNIFNRMRDNNFIVYTPTIVMRRDCLEKTGWLDEKMQWSADYNFSIRLAYYFDAGIIYEPLMMRRMHPSNRSVLMPIENYNGYITTFEYLYRHKMVEKKYLYKAKSQAFFNIAELYTAQGQFAKARKNYIESLRYNPLRARCYWQLARSLKGKRTTGELRAQ